MKQRLLLLEKCFSKYICSKNYQNICQISRSYEGSYWKLVVSWRRWRFLQMLIRKSKLNQERFWVTVLKEQERVSRFSRYFRQVIPMRCSNICEDTDESGNWNPSRFLYIEIFQEIKRVFPGTFFRNSSCNAFEVFSQDFCLFCMLCFLASMP